MANLTNSAKLIEEMGKKVNSSSLATVATSGSYTDLSNKPTIPTVNNSTIKIQKNSADVDSFTTNASSGKTINITMTKSDVGLGNVDNTSDASKPISNATQTALNAKADANSVYTKAEVDSAISSAVSSVYKYKGSVANYASLPTTGLTVGDVYNVEDTGDNYAWTGAAWDKLAGTVDLSSYLTKSEASSTYATKTEVDAKANTSDLPSAMTASELNTGTSTTGRTVSAALLKAGITGAINAKIDTREYSSSWDGSGKAPTQDAVYDKINAMDTTIGNKANTSDVVLKNSDATQLITATNSSVTVDTPLSVKSNTSTSYIALNGSSGFLGSYGVTSDKNPTFYNGSSHQLAYTTDIPTVNNGTLTITLNGTSKGTFTANQSGNSTIALTDTTYESKAAASGGTAVSLVTTGEKYTWNNKIDSSALPSDMTLSELNTGTSTTGRTVSAILLKTAITGAIKGKADKTEVLTKTNTTSFTPDSDYQPATKKYVDDAVAGTSSTSTLTLTLLSTGWDSNKQQTLNATGVTASNTVIVSPAPSNIGEYTGAGIYCSAQASGTLTFTCASLPDNDIPVNVVILG